MALVQSQVDVSLPGDLPADFLTHTLYHVVSGDIWDELTGTGWQSHADELRDVFSGVVGGFLNYQNATVEVKVYDMGQAIPRQPMAVSLHTPGSFQTRAALGPAQVSLVMSYYAGRNIPGLRSRLFTGLWPPNSGPLSSRPSDTYLANVLALGSAINGVGGANVQWVVCNAGTLLSAKGVKPQVYGPTKSGYARHATHNVTNVWCDDRWDTQRRRLPKATHRSAVAVS